MPDVRTLIDTALKRNRREAIDVSTRMGRSRLAELLKRAEGDLVRRLHQAEGLKGPGKGSFTAEQLKTTIAQVRDVTNTLARGIGTLAVGQARTAADRSAGNLIDYLSQADRAFRGMGVQPMALREAAILNSAVSGAESSVLRRLASSGEPTGTLAEPHPAKQGILQRYGVGVIEHFERSLSTGLVSRKPWAEVRDDLIGGSPFLQQAPAYWAERIIRCETHSAFSRAAWEGMREADTQLGDMAKILCAIIDERTGSDSLSLHGQIRRVDEPFVWNSESGVQMYMHPPNRPNDRETVTPHRISWPIPPELKPLDWSIVVARWREEKRKGSPPKRATVSTIPMDRFGRDRA